MRSRFVSAWSYSQLECVRKTKSRAASGAEVGTREQLNIHSTSGWCNFEIPPRANTQPHTTLKAWPRSPDGVERRPGADPDEALPARVDGGTRGVVW